MGGIQQEKQMGKSPTQNQEMPDYWGAESFVSDV